MSNATKRNQAGPAAIHHRLRVTRKSAQQTELEMMYLVICFGGRNTVPELEYIWTDHLFRGLKGRRVEGH